MYTLACPSCSCSTQAPNLDPHTTVHCQNQACLYSGYADKWIVTAYPTANIPVPTLGTFCVTKYCPKCYARKDYAINITTNMLSCAHCNCTCNEAFWLSSPPVPSNSQLTGSIKWVSKEELRSQYPSKSACAAPACEIVHVTLMSCEYDYCRTHKIEVDKDSDFPPSYL